MKVDLPAFGMPSRPTSASTFNSSARRAALAGLAARELARRAVDARLEVDVAEAALAAAREHRALAVLGQVGDQLARLLVADDGADRHGQIDVAARRAIAVAPGAARRRPLRDGCARSDSRRAC